jgi:hypothetical protein
MSALAVLGRFAHAGLSVLALTAHAQVRFGIARSRTALQRLRSVAVEPSAVTAKVGRRRTPLASG